MDKKIRIHFIRKNIFQKKSFSEKLFFRKNLPMSYRKPNTIFYSERKINSWEKLFYSSGTEWKRKTEKCGKPNAFFLFFRRFFWVSERKNKNYIWRKTFSRVKQLKKKSKRISFFSAIFFIYYLCENE